MKFLEKLLLALLGATICHTAVFAGGPMTNTNQSAAFLRSLARGTSLQSDAVYYNPAGVVFMDNGFHIGINDQMAKQTRTTSSSLVMGNNLPGGFSETEFQGSVFSPLVPSVHFAWKHNRIALMAGMGVNGGGGTIKYDNGLASFERIVSSFPTLLTANGLTTTQYSRDLFLEGSSMTLAFNFGAAFRITDWLSVAAMVRYSSSSNSYKAGLSNMMLNPAHPLLNPNSGMISASQLLTSINMGTYAALVDQQLDVKQKGSSFSPVLALSFHKGKWDASVKYEFEMRTELENETSKDINLGTGGMFPNGAKVKAETPALLAVAVSRHFGPVKVTAEWHEFFDKNAENSFSNVITGNTTEYLLGAEWQITDKWLVSAGAQYTALDMDPAKYSDMNFSCPSVSVGLGFMYSFSEKIGLNFGVMPTFYQDVTSTGIHSFGGMNLGQYTDVFSRTSIACGLGLDIKLGR
ncbi:MAG: outer membrane protein transport protein [Alistipes sp.]|nr:outer membrane protein transport protein [Alistipes sp.]MBQ5922213.1 outer membrane protein transport protein [Alistipes sp.]